MSLLWIDGPGTGKSFTAFKSCWATLADRVKAVCLFGGRNKTMAGKHNYILDFLRIEVIVNMIKDYVSKIKRDNEWDEELVEYTDALMTRGDFVTLQNGAYVSSALVQYDDYGSKDWTNVILTFDEDGKPFNCLKDGKRIAPMYLIYVPVDVNGVFNINHVNCMVNMTILMDATGTIKFEGFPWLQIGESAVMPAQKVVYPAYESVNQVSSSLNGTIEKSLKRDIGDLLVRLLDFQSKNNGVIKIFNEKGLIWEKCSSQFKEAIEKKELSDALFRRYCSELGFSSNVKTEPTENGKIVEPSLVLKKLINKCIAYSAIDLSVQGIIQANPTNFIEHSDKFIKMDEFGSPKMVAVPVLSILFRCARSIIDSASIFVYGIGSGGQTLSGGLNASFLSSLLSYTTSENFMMYPPVGAKDPLMGYNLKGYCNGIMSGVRGEKKDGTLTEYYEWLFTTTRNADNKQRHVDYLVRSPKYCLGNDQMRITKEDGSFLFKTYEELGLEGMYDPKLAITRENVNDESNIYVKDIPEVNWDVFSASAFLEKVDQDVSSSGQTSNFLNFVEETDDYGEVDERVVTSFGDRV